MKIIFSEGSGLNDSIYGKCQAPIRMFLEQRELRRPDDVHDRHERI